MSDVDAASAWHFGMALDSRPATRRVIAARRCAYAACRELGFTWNEIANEFDRHHTTVVGALNGSEVDPDDLAAVLANARARALADSEVVS